MSNTLNTRAATFAHRALFLAEPDPGFLLPSRSARQLANDFCVYDKCPDYDSIRVVGCRAHARSMVLGLGKLFATGIVHAELSNNGVLFAKLSIAGVLEPLSWSTPPGWFADRPKLVDWAMQQSKERPPDLVSVDGRTRAWKVPS